MKKQILLLTAACGFIYLTFSSNASGPAQNGNGDQTGRISLVSCGSTTPGCHNSGGTGSTSITLEIRRKDWGPTSAPVNGFIAGQTYLVTLKGTNSTVPKFGFQLLAHEGTPAPGVTSIGTFSNLPTNVHSKQTGTLNIIEHGTPLSKDGSGNFVVDVEWTAPATTSATHISFAAVINAVDGNGLSTGDRPSSPAGKVLSNVTSVENLTSNMHIKAYPNPVIGDYLTLDMENVTAGSYTVNAYSVNGAHVYHNELSLNSGKATQAINTERWAAGVYVLHIHNGDAQKMITVVKQ